MDDNTFDGLLRKPITKKISFRVIDVFPIA